MAEIALESVGCTIESAPFVVVDDHKANIMGGILLPQIGIRLVQEKQKQHQILNTKQGG